MIKETGEQPEEEVHRARSGRVLSAGASVPIKLRCVTFPVWMCLLTWKLSEPHTIGILWRLHHIGMVNYNNISSPPPLSGGCRVELKIPGF